MTGKGINSLVSGGVGNAKISPEDQLNDASLVIPPISNSAFTFGVPQKSVVPPIIPPPSSTSEALKPLHDVSPSNKVEPLIAPEVEKRIEILLQVVLPLETFQNLKK
ncbi:hypothetical protein FQA39_LY02704 [Lamprigera yunnana]|nr:hypothetical protein FQA39_LY02704 [Lamprigera yunnana]